MEQILFINKKTEIEKSNFKDIKKRPIDNKIKYGYRKSNSKLDSCGNCKNCITALKGKNYYYKCKLIGNTNSVSSDIRISYVCNLLEK